MGVYRTAASGDTIKRTTNNPATITSSTLMGWFRLASDRNNFGNFLGFGKSATARYISIGVGTDGTVFELWDDLDAADGSQLTVGVWYHVALVIPSAIGGGANIIAYLNGNQNVTNASGSSSPLPELIQINGSNDSTSQWIDGNCCAIKIYSAILTRDEIEQEMWFWTPQRKRDLNSWLPMKDISGIDRLRGFNFTIAGSPSIDNNEPPMLRWDAPQKRFRSPVKKAAAATTPNVDTWGFPLGRPNADQFLIGVY